MGATSGSTVASIDTTVTIDEPRSAVGASSSAAGGAAVGVVNVMSHAIAARLNNAISARNHIFDLVIAIASVRSRVYEFILPR